MLPARSCWVRSPFANVLCMAKKIAKKKKGENPKKGKISLNPIKS